MLGETRAGLRRWTGTPQGDSYQTLLAHLGEGDYADPSPHERLLGDLVDPTRTGGVMAVANAASREVRVDAAAWPLDRLLGMVAAIEAEPDRPPMPEP